LNRQMQDNPSKSESNSVHCSKTTSCTLETGNAGLKTRNCRLKSETRNKNQETRNTKLKTRSGQVATEFMLYISVFMFIAIIAFVVVSQLQRSEIPLQQNTVAKETGEGFVTIITLAVKGGDGFSYNYTFPKTLFGSPYKLYLMPNNDDLIMEWQGSYGNFSYSYSVPAYNYHLGGCVSEGILISDECSNMLTLNNDGENLTITQSG